MALDKALFSLGLSLFMVKRREEPTLSPRALTFDSDIITSPCEEGKRGRWAVTFTIVP